MPQGVSVQASQCSRRSSVSWKFFLCTETQSALFKLFFTPAWWDTPIRSQLGSSLLFHKTSAFPPASQTGPLAFPTTAPVLQKGLEIYFIHYLSWTLKTQSSGDLIPLCTPLTPTLGTSLQFCTAL